MKRNGGRNAIVFTIVYWSKDYRVVLDHPVHREGKGLHMMYMIPARFVTPLDTDTIEHVGDVNIVIRCKEELKRLYVETLNNNNDEVACK